MSTIISSSRTNHNFYILAIGLVTLAYFLAVSPQTAWQAATDEESLARQRNEMVERDLRRRGIKDENVLAAMGAIPRHLFVPERERASAYEDRPLPIGDGQTISQPYIVAWMTELLELRSSEKILEIGTGSGYQAAVLARLGAEVFSIEILPKLSARAGKILAELGYRNVQLRVADGFFGWQEKGPFDAILLTAAAPKIPEPLWRQLKEDGRLVMPLGDAKGREQKLIRARKSAGRPIIENLSAVRFVPLTGAVESPPR